jgi:polysaccharide transporter, PST family
MTPEHERTAVAAAIKSRALTGAALVVARGVVVRLLGFASYVVVARFVSPREFGFFTLGAAVVTAGQFLADAGLAAALVRQKPEPTPQDLRAVQGLQLSVSASLAVVAALIGALIGGNALVVGVMISSLPIITLRVPAMALLERHLEYRPLVVVEVAETLAFSIFVIVAVLLGAGVWGLGLAVVVRAIVGTVALTAVGPVGFVRPTLDIERVRPILRFGAKFQAVGAVTAATDQIFNVAVATIAGVGVLGIWGLAYRIMLLPQIVFMSLRRVSYPAMARLIGTGEDLRTTVERTARLALVGTGLLLVPLVGSSSALVPIVFGERWADATDILPGISLGLMISGPVSVAVAGYLLAADEAGVVLRAVVLRVCGLLVVGLSLLPVVGVVALGLAYLASALFEAMVLRRAAARSLGVELVRTLLPGCLAAACAGAAGWAASTAMGVTIAACAVGGLGSLGLFLLMLWVFANDSLLDTLRVSRQLLERRPGRTVPDQAEAGISATPTS